MHKLSVSDGATHQRCFLRDTQDALLILQSVLNNKLLLTQRRPTDQTRQDLIKSGNVFVVDIAKGPINRWTDGLSWSPSRILGAFLLYREKKQGKRGVKIGHVSKKSKSDLSPGSPNRHSQYKKTSVASLSMMPPGMPIPPELGYPGFLLENPKQQSNEHTLQMPSQMPNQMPNQMLGHPHHQHSNSLPNGQLFTTSPRSPTNNSQSDEYTLYGSLTSNEQYKVNGLLKKTITIGFRESVYRIVGYYLPKDVEEKRLLTPSQDGFFRGIRIDPELSDSKNIKMPVAINERDYEQLDPIYGLPLGPNSSMRNYFPIDSGPMDSNFTPVGVYDPNKQIGTPLSENAFDDSNSGRGDVLYSTGSGSTYNLMSSHSRYDAQSQQVALGAIGATYGQPFDPSRSSHRGGLPQQLMGDMRSMQDNRMRGSRFVESRYPQISPELANKSWHLGQDQFDAGERNRENSAPGVFQDQYEKDFKYSSASCPTMAPQSNFSLDDQLQLATSKDLTIQHKPESIINPFEGPSYSDVQPSNKLVSEQASQEIYTPVTSTNGINPLDASMNGSGSFPVSLINHDHREFNPLFTNESPSGSSLLSDLSAECYPGEFKSEGSKLDEQDSVQNAALQSQQQQQRQQQQQQQQDQQNYLSAASAGMFDERQF